jgi:hypothetical protein
MISLILILGIVLAIATPVTMTLYVIHLYRMYYNGIRKMFIKAATTPYRYFY